MANKTLSKKDRKIRFLEEGLTNNGNAMIENTKRYWSIHDMKRIKPLSKPQQDMFEYYFLGNDIVANGSAGTGKTLAGIFLGLNDVLSKERKQKKLMIVRSVASTREIGFLPGTPEEKTSVYETPYRDLVGFIMNNKNAYDSMKAAGQIEFMITSFVRGLTWDDCVVVVDEVQNCNYHEISSVMTRIGDDSKVIVCGDQIQTDLYKSHDKCGMDRFLRVADRMENFRQVNFTKHDVIRSGFVKDWIWAAEAELEKAG